MILKVNVPKVKNMQIEGLRGITCLIIVLYHIVYRYQELYEEPSNILVTIMKHWGNFGVAIFMIISAYYLYSKNLFKDNLLKYYFKKVIRLWPVYLICITFTFALLQIAELPGRTVGVKEYLLNAFMINGFIGINYVDGAHWYITSMLSIIFVVGILLKLKLQDNHLAYLVWLILGIHHFTSN